MSALHALWSFLGSGRSVAASGFDLPPVPLEPLCIVGDIHGRADLAERLLTLWQTRMPQVRVVFLGDYIDRGEGSAAVLRLLHAAQADGRVICLSGNHEAMLCDFLDDPVGCGPLWLGNGGLQTLSSFGLRGPGTAMEAAALIGCRDNLLAALGPGLTHWLRTLPLWWQSGTLAMVHAGADPALPLAAQSPDVLRWGHPMFRKKSRSDGIWVAHGHSVVRAAHAADGRIALDTGAFATGRLSYMLVDQYGLDLHVV